MAQLKQVKTVNMHEAKTHLSRLVEDAVRGESFIIAKAGKPMVRVSPIDPPSSREEQRGPRLGFGTSPIIMPKDFDRFAEREIADMFGLND